jgi:hypothetical protein
MGLARVRITKDPSLRVRDICVNHEVEAPRKGTELKVWVLDMMNQKNMVWGREATSLSWDSYPQIV